jgi:hypothetical protein
MLRIKLIFLFTFQKASLSSGLSLESIDSSNKSMDMDPPGLNTPLVGTDSAHRTPILEHASTSTAAKYDTRGVSRTGTEKSIGEISPSKGSLESVDLRSERSSDWSGRTAGPVPDDSRSARYDHDRYGANGRPVTDTRYGHSDNNRPGLRYRSGDYDRDRDRERDRDRDWERDRDRDRRFDFANRPNERRNDDRFRRPQSDTRHYESRYDSKSNDPLRRWDSKSSVDSPVSPAARPLDSRPAENRPPRSVTEERSFDARDARPSSVDYTYDSRTFRAPPGQERPFESRVSRPAPEARPLDSRGLGAAPSERSLTDKTEPAMPEDRGPVPPASSSDRPFRADDGGRPSFAKPVEDDRRLTDGSSQSTRAQDQRLLVDDRRPAAPIPSPLSNNTSDRRPPPSSATLERQRPYDSSATSDRSVRGSLSDYSARRLSLSGPDRTSQTSTPSRPLTTQDERHPPLHVQPSLEERLGPPPASLKDRLNTRPVEESVHARVDDRSRPASEPRPSVPSANDRGNRTVPEQTVGHKSAGDATASHPIPVGARPVNSEPNRQSSSAAYQTRVVQESPRGANSSPSIRNVQPPSANSHGARTAIEQPASNPSVPDKQTNLVFENTDSHTAHAAGSELNQSNWRARTVPPAQRSTGHRPDSNFVPNATHAADSDFGQPKLQNAHVVQPTRQGTSTANFVSKGSHATEPDVSQSTPQGARTIQTSRRSIGRPPYIESDESATVKREDEVSSFKPSDSTVSPRRAEHHPPERSTYPDRYERDVSRERRSDVMEADAPRYSDRRTPASYRRPSPIPYSRPDARTWPPAGESYPPRHTHDSPVVYGRDWPGEQRGPYEEWDRRSWDRERPVDQDHDYDRDPRYYGRDAASASWETREVRERRLAYPSDGPPTSQAYESRPPPDRLFDTYPPDDRDRPYDRPRYADAPQTAPRVRPRSPSPGRRAGSVDLQPPLKRSRDEGYGSSYYARPPRDYLLPPPATSIYRDDYPHPSGSVGLSDRRDHAFQDRDYPVYEHHDGYTRDRRYGMPPGRP